MIRIFKLQLVVKEHHRQGVHHFDRNGNSVSERIIIPYGKQIFFSIEVYPLELAVLKFIRIYHKIVSVDIRQVVAVRN